MTFRFWLLLGSILVLMIGCGKQSESTDAANPAQMVSVKLSLNWKPEPEFGGFYTADVNGFYKQRHLTVDITGGGDQVPQLLAAGKCDFGILAADEVVTARAKRIDLVALF